MSVYMYMTSLEKETIKRALRDAAHFWRTGEAPGLAVDDGEPVIDTAHAFPIAAHLLERLAHEPRNAEGEVHIRRAIARVRALAAAHRSIRAVDDRSGIHTASGLESAADIFEAALR